jgi:hypothetical protein
VIARHMRTAYLIVGLCAVLMLGGCKREIANRNLQQVKRNMSQKEVETILGQPDSTDRKDDDGDGEKRYAGLITYYYVQDGQKIALQFFNGHLVREPDLLKEH